MKTTNFYLTAFLATILVLITSCTSMVEISNRYYVSILIDKTDSNTHIPSAERIWNNIPTYEIQDGMCISIVNITNTIHSASKKIIELDEGDVGMMSNDFTRKNQYKKLFMQFQAHLEYDTAVYHYQQSDIFRTVVQELNDLERYFGVRKMILWSDLLEHTDYFSIYNPKDRKQLFSQPEKVQALFVSQVDLLDDYSGIRIQIIHNPNSEHLGDFNHLVQLYKSIFESRGATIEIGMNEQIII